jgi:MFS family permease
MTGGSSPVPGGIRLPLFYGWLLVAVAFVTMALGVNARTAFSLLFPAILDEFGWDRGITAGAFSFGFLVSAVVTPFAGRLMDLRGPRIIVELGVLTMGAGLILASISREPWQLARCTCRWRRQLPRLYRAVVLPKPAEPEPKRG